MAPSIDVGAFCQWASPRGKLRHVGERVAGGEKAPGEVSLYQAEASKSIRGMGSLVCHGAPASAAPFTSRRMRPSDKLVPEAIEVPLPTRVVLAMCVHPLVGGLRRGNGLYLGNATPRLQIMRGPGCANSFTHYQFAGLRESHCPRLWQNHPVESPNYGGLDAGHWRADPLLVDVLILNAGA